MLKVEAPQYAVTTQTTLLFTAVLTFNIIKSKAVPVHAMKAYMGVGV
jgi:hypothetical protein